MAGAGVADKRWSDKRKKVIEESRTKSCDLLVRSLRDIPNKVQAVISTSAIGWYGPDPSIPNPRPFEESDPSADDFLGETCRRWEAAIAPVTALGKRLVIIRTGIVLAKTGGALAEFKRPVRFGVAAILGSGRQTISWIHAEDLCRLFMRAIDNSEWTGIFNGVAPRPVTNRILTLELAKKLKGRLDSKPRFFRNRTKKKIPAPISAPRPRTVPKTMGSTGGPEEFGVVPLVGVVVGLEMLAEG